jgi:hypothetical protein
MPRHAAMRVYFLTVADFFRVVADFIILTVYAEIIRLVIVRLQLRPHDERPPWAKDGLHVDPGLCLG